MTLPSAPYDPAAIEIGPVPPEKVSACVVCAFMAQAIERRTFFLFAESIGESWFVDAMRHGGFCLRHGRHVLRHDGAVGLTIPYREMLRAWRARLGVPASTGPDRFTGQGCPQCTTARWAESHALWRLAEPVTRNATSTLGAEGPICLPHLDRLLDAVSPWRVPVIATMIDDRLRAIAESDLSHAVPAIAGEDLDRDIRQVPPVDEPASTHVGEGRGAASDLLGLALDAGRCPVCESAHAAARWPIDWLANPPRPQDLRDLARLCGRHMHDAARSPAAAAHAVHGSRTLWLAMLRALPSSDDIGPRGIRGRAASLHSRFASQGRRQPAVNGAVEALRAPDRGLARQLTAARTRRSAPCVACEAAVTTTARTIALVGALLPSRLWLDRFERSDGLCLRHVEAAHNVLAGRPWETISQVADARAARLGWELDEAARLISWSVRYEPAGPEADAWSRAIVFALGENVQDGWPLGPDGDEVHPSA